MENSLKQKELEEGAKVKTKEVYRGKVFTVTQEIVQFDNLPPHQWDRIIHPGAVAILPITSTGNLLLIQQWRRPIRKIIYELPAGTLDPNEPIETCAQRELQEETGFKAAKLTPLGGFYSAPGFCNEYLYLFIAENLSESPLEKDDHEAIDLAEMSLDKALSLIDRGEIEDVKTLYAILRYARMQSHA